MDYFRVSILQNKHSNATLTQVISKENLLAMAQCNCFMSNNTHLAKAHQQFFDSRTLHTQILPSDNGRRVRRVAVENNKDQMHDSVLQVNLKLHDFCINTVKIVGR